MRKKAPLYWINPLSHHVYDGWLELLAAQYDLTVLYYDGVPRPQYRTQKLRSIRNFRVIDTTAGFYRKPIIPAGTRVIVGDIYTSNLCWLLRGPNVIYYTEYFRYAEGARKRIAFWFTARWFRGRKFIVPTQQALATVRKFTDNVAYFPQLWSGAVRANLSLKRAGPLKLLFVGVLRDWKKNVAWLLETLATIPDVQITLCGLLEGFPVEKYETLLGKRVTFLNEVPHEKLRAVYAAHHALVLPSIVDPIGAVVLEAMAHGLPVIVTKQAGASSYVEHGVNGFVIEPDAKQLSKAVRSLAAPATRARMGAASVRLLRTNYALDNRVVREQAIRKLEDLFASPARR